MLMPDIIAMPRGQLLDWMSVLCRSALYIIVLLTGWQAYRLAVWLKQAPRQIIASETVVAGSATNDGAPASSS
jgi:hypothetical protein